MFKLFAAAALVLTVHAQDVCKHCPSPADMRLQFGADADELKPHERVFTKTFWLEEGGHGAALAFDATATAKLQGPRCLEGHNGFAEREHNSEIAFDAAVEFAAVFALHAMLKYAGPPKHLRWVPHAPTTYATIVHANAGSQWLRKCQ